MKRTAFVLIMAAIVVVSTCYPANAKIKTRYHVHNGEKCYISSNGTHHPASYDRSSLEILIRQNKKTIKTAGDIINRAGNDKLKTMAQQIMENRKKENEQLDLLRKELSY